MDQIEDDDSKRPYKVSVVGDNKRSDCRVFNSSFPPKKNKKEKKITSVLCAFVVIIHMSLRQPNILIMRPHRITLSNCPI
jgi:hypothetical protein